MKTRIYGFILVLAVLAVLFVLTNDGATVKTDTAVDQSQPSTNDSDFKGLKIQ